MKYPNGDMVCIGDLIWWNEGSSQGVVVKVLEFKEDFESLSLATPKHETVNQLKNFGSSEKGIMICANLQRDEMTMDVFCPECDFEDEAISLIHRRQERGK